MLSKFFDPPHAQTQAYANVSRLSYLPGLDGIRALAVLAVILYHADVDWLPGGFLGVEIFFVVSGYLITLLLLSEYRADHSVNFTHFWQRRARRLLPALCALILAVLVYVVIFLPEEVAGLRAEVLSAFTYSTNWYLILAHKSYFATVGRPSLLRHLWSLAVEEQFYLVWPLLVAFLLAHLPWQRLLLVFMVGAALSTLWMGILFQPDADPSRVYYGTDTRAAGLCLGAALAVVWTPRVTSTSTTHAGCWLLDATGGVALGALVAACVLLHEFEPFLYHGGMLFVAVATTLMIAAVVHPQSPLLGPLMSLSGLRWIGRRSYSLYLWHWPVFMVTRPQLDVTMDGAALWALRMGMTFFLAELSYRLIETPVRHGALGTIWTVWQHAQGRRRWGLGLAGMGVVIPMVVAVLLLGSAVMNAQPPREPAYVTMIAEDAAEGQMQQHMRHVHEGSMPAVLPPQRPSGSTATASAVLPARPQPPQVLALGDSVMLGASQAVRQAVTDVEVDAHVGRQVAAVLTILRTRKIAHRLASTVVIHVGNNGTFSIKQFEEMMQLLQEVPRVVFLTNKVPRKWQKPNNNALTDGVSRYPNARLIDWRARSAAHPEWFWQDGIHLRPEGAKMYATLIATTIQ